MKQLTVGLGDRAYPIFIEHGCLGKIGADLAKRRIGNRYLIIADATVAEIYGETVLRSLQASGLAAELVTFPAGEASKNLETFTFLCRKMAELKYDRKDAIVALGGGVTGDLAGFVAASYMRGIPFVQVPTTLLSQVDSSVGGKTGVDIPEGKNLVGAFYQPKAVYIDPTVLQTLDREELLGGIAEVIKYGVIRDKAFFSYLKDNSVQLLAQESEVLSHVIATCCRIKAEVVAEDEKESNVRRILNYGHTIGHAVETASKFSLIHGKAVAIGMVAAARIAVRKGLLRPVEYEEIVGLLRQYGLPLEVPQCYDASEMKGYILTDKKVVSGRVFYILPQTIGSVAITDDVDANDVAHALSPLTAEISS